MPFGVQLGTEKTRLTLATKPTTGFAHEPWTRPVATLGGATATNSLGYMGAKYGTIGNRLLGLEAVLPNGTLLRTRPALGQTAARLGFPPT